METLKTKVGNFIVDFSTNSVFHRCELIEKNNVGVYIVSDDEFDTIELGSKTVIAPTKVHLPTLVHIGNNFLNGNVNLHTISLPLCESIGNNFLNDNVKLSNILLPLCESIGGNFLNDNVKLSNISLPLRESILDNFILK